MSGEPSSPSAISAPSCASPKLCHQPSAGHSPFASAKLAADSNDSAAAGTGFGPRSGTLAPPAKRAKSADVRINDRSEEHTSELQSLMRISYAVFFWTKTNHTLNIQKNGQHVPDEC